MNKGILLIGILLLAGISIYTLSVLETTSNEDSEPVVQEMSADEFKDKTEEDSAAVQNSGVVIDVRTQEEYDDGHLTLTDHHYNLLDGNFAAHLDSLDKEKTYYLYCRSGNRSGQAAKLMEKAGFSKVYNIGGFTDLVESGLEKE